MSEQILIVDDEKEIADLIEVYLKNDGPYRHTEKTLSAYKNTAYVLLGGALCKAWQLILSCFSLCALVKRCFMSVITHTSIPRKFVGLCRKATYSASHLNIERFPLVVVAVRT